MGARGPKPSAGLGIASDNTEKLAQRPEPLEHLTPEQQQVWRETVNAMPADWFRKETLEVLGQYCRHVITARSVANQIADMEASADKFDVREYALLLRCQKAETEAINSTATKLRLTLQSTYDKSKKKGTQSRKPWEA